MFRCCFGCEQWRREEDQLLCAPGEELGGIYKLTIIGEGRQNIVITSESLADLSMPFKTKYPDISGASFVFSAGSPILGSPILMSSYPLNHGPINLSSASNCTSSKIWFCFKVLNSTLVCHYISRASVPWIVSSPTLTVSNQSVQFLSLVVRYLADVVSTGRERACTHTTQENAVNGLKKHSKHGHISPVNPPNHTSQRKEINLNRYTSYLSLSF